MVIESQLGKNSEHLKPSQREIHKNLFNAARENSESTTQNIKIFKLNAGVKEILPIFQIHVLMKVMIVSVMEEFSMDKSSQRVKLKAHQSTQSNQ
jgi:hypothetical protein